MQHLFMLNDVKIITNSPWLVKLSWQHSYTSKITYSVYEHSKLGQA